MYGARVQPGDVLGGKYRVERIIGSGGMGVVVAARHIDLGQQVALKFMLPEAMADPSHGERFLREAKAAVQLKSVHTARVLDVGRLKNDQPFMVMEYLDGRDLDAELVARGPMPPHVAVDYVLQASEALAEAHGLGMVHRDVKLKNLFLTTTVDGRPLVKVLDFGLAKTSAGRGEVSLTALNSVFGSPQYMSPEQMRSAKDADVRSDIWSMGICLYELLTGRVPFDAGGVAEICAMVLKDPVCPPSEHIAGIPSDLEHAILRCLEKNPDERFQSFAELASALQNYSPDEGSARRILHVMQSAQKADHPTLTSSPPQPWDEGPKTLNAWDSGRGASSFRLTQLSPTQMGVALVLCAAIAMTGVAVGFAALRRMHQNTAAAAVAFDAPPVTIPTSTIPQTPPTATTPPTTAAAPTTDTGAASTTVALPPPGTVIGASPAETPDSAPTDGANGHSPRGIARPARTPPPATAGPRPTTSPARTGSSTFPSTATGGTKPGSKARPGPGDYM